MKRNEGVDLLAHLREVWRGDAWVKPFFIPLSQSACAYPRLGACGVRVRWRPHVHVGLHDLSGRHAPVRFSLCTFPRCSFVFSDWASPFFNISSVLASHDWVLRMTSELRRRLYETVERMTSAVRKPQVAR